MRERALLPLKSYRDFTKIAEAWLTTESFVEEQELRRLMEHTLSSAWDSWCERRDLSDWCAEIDTFIGSRAYVDDHLIMYSHAKLIQEVLVRLFEELECTLLLIQIPKEQVYDVRIFFDNIAIDYDLPFNYEVRNNRWHKLL